MTALGRSSSWQPRGVGRRPTLSLNEWAVLGVLVDRPRHGYDIAAELRPGSAVGDVWRLQRPVVYRGLERLEALGLVEVRGTEPGAAGGPRTIYGPTRRGHAAVRSWLVTPVAHLRDVRSALLLKLVLLDRLERDRGPLVQAQRTAFADQLRELAVRPRRRDVISTWRHHSAQAVDAFLGELERPGAMTRRGKAQ